MANKYWDSFLKKDHSKVQLKETKNKPLEISDGGMAAFFAGMAMHYNPNVISDLKAVLQFNLDDDQYYLTVNENICKAYNGSYSTPSLTINSPKDVWMKISSGELSGMAAFMDQLYTVDGDFKLLMKMNELFSRPDENTQSKEKSEKSL
jgi:putative sterol carrier protein